MGKLTGKVAVVAGATRGAGRGIATMLGELGATVYCTGRSTRGNPASGANRPETIEETAEMVDSYGGKGIAVQVDHLEEEQVQKLFERVKSEQGKLDILVNDVWGGDRYMQWNTPFWELKIPQGLQMLKQAIHSHIITSRYGVPLLVERKEGIVIEVTDGNGPYYRGELFYDLVKTSVARLAYSQAHELRPHKITALAVTPGFLRSEEMLDHFGVKEANWRDGAKVEKDFIASETPYFVGRAVAALCADPNVFEKTGGTYSSWQLSDEYGFIDMDGRSPHWGNYFREIYGYESGLEKPLT
jgi:NAD(P)-dependent dehydrogenase (short-subunit alcohol dehydrogenase family)